ncbi:MAG: acetate--CoA ligase [Pseudomonadota bacterium]
MPNETPIIRKGGSFAIPPNLENYEEARRNFSWAEARGDLDGLPDGRLNIAYEAVDRHVLHGLGGKTAIRWISKDNVRRDICYAELSTGTDRFANALKALGVGKDDAVFVLAGRVPELYIAALGTLKNGSVFCPMFSAFGPEPIRTRMERGDAAVLVTTQRLFERKVANWWRELPSLKHIILIDAGDSKEDGVIGWSQALQKAGGGPALVQTMPEDRALLHFTSGTTGRPKGAIHVHAAVIAHHVTGQFALDMHPDDIFWCTADPGWVTGTSYGIIAPLTNGLTMIVDEAEFDAARWYRILQEEKVTIWYTAPTAIRMLMKSEDSVPPPTRHSLRFMASVGEPLNPDAVVWSNEKFGLPFHDNWWQTETGGIMIANYASMDVKPGSMGRPLPGMEAAIVNATEEGRIEITSKPMTVGELALKTGWPSMFRGYLHEEERYQKHFRNGWYLTGDLAMQDADGYFWFVGRADDLIKSAGHLIGPFEVESALTEHPAIAEAAVIGLPDEVAGEVVKAFVALKPGIAPSEEIRKDILGYTRKRLGPAVAPKFLEFTGNLPKTRSGKIMRRLLKARELGLPEGDISTLEGAP